MVRVGYYGPCDGLNCRLLRAARLQFKLLKPAGFVIAAKIWRVIK